MAGRHRPTDVDGSAFYVVAICAACVLGWRDFLVMFIGELWGLKLLLGPLILTRVMEPFGSLVDLMHQFLVKRFGEFKGVVVTAIVILLVVRGSLAISARPHSAYRHASQSTSTEESPGS